MGPEVANQSLVNEYLPDEPDERQEKIVDFLKDELEEEPESSSLYAKFLPALHAIIESLKQEDITDILAQNRPTFSLISAIERAGVPEVELTDKEVQQKFKAIEMKEGMLERAGGTVGVNDVKEILGIGRQAVNKRRNAGKLIGLDLGGRGYQYPVCQFDENKGGTVPGLEVVLEYLSPTETPWMALQFLVRDNPRLKGNGKPRPIDRLKQGNVDPVIKAAKTHGEHGAV